jgi:hypothetical protein
MTSKLRMGRSLPCRLAVAHVLTLGLLCPLDVLVFPASSQGRRCDPLLEQPPGNPYGYRLRGERCEGVYVQQVASTTLLVASFTEAFPDYDLASDRNLVIDWSAPAPGEVQLRAHGLRRKLYYRMDATRPAASHSFTWPVDLLAALSISRPDVGVVGWMRHSVGPTDRDVYLPLRVGRPREASRREAYVLVLVPGVPLSEVYVSLAPVGRDGRPTTFIRDEEALRYNYYPADRPIDIPISPSLSPGLHYLLIGATLGTGGSATAELWFYRAPR